MQLFKYKLFNEHYYVPDGVLPDNDPKFYPWEVK